VQFLGGWKNKHSDETITNPLRVNIPKNPDQLIQLAKSIIAKHGDDGTASPLSGLDMADMSAKTTTADTEHKNAVKLRRDAETAPQNRDLALGTDNAARGTVAHYVRSARDMLLGLHKGNEQRLGEWGFEVDTSVRGGGGEAPTPPSQ